MFRYIGTMSALNLYVVFLVTLQAESPKLSPPHVETIGVVMDTPGSGTFWLLLSLLPAGWEIRTWPTSKGPPGGARGVSLMLGSAGMLCVIMQVITNQQAAASRTSSRRGQHLHPGFLRERAGPRAQQTRELHTRSLPAAPAHLDSCSGLAWACSPGSSVGARSKMCRLESVCSTQSVSSEGTAGRPGSERPSRG